MPKLGARVSVVGLLAFGTLTSLFSKIVYELEGTGLDGEVRFFRKPWFMTLIMFLGMSMCLPLSFLESKLSGSGAEPCSEPLLNDGGNGQDVQKKSETREALMLCIPTVFDLIATVLMNIGLLSVTASVYQMMRGAEMVFAAVLAVMFLHRHLNCFHFGGIASCICGILLVGLSSVLSGDGGSQVHTTSAQVAMGMGLIVLSQAVQAAQVTFEDYFMSEMSIPPMKIVGYEGAVGATLMLFVVSPIVRLLPGQEGDGIHEDIIDSLHMVASNPRLMGVIAAQMLGLLAYNFMGMSVTGNLGAVFRTVLETMRTLFVWIVGIILFYTGSGLGEGLNKYSPIQAAGFVVLVLGTVIYSRGDDQAANLAVEQYQQLQLDIESGGDMLQDSSVMPISIESAAPIHINSAASSFRASRTIAAGSFQEALVTSYKSHTLGTSFH